VFEPFLVVPQRVLLGLWKPGASLSLSDNPNLNAGKDTYDYSCYKVRLD
jgi:hypothetical protein